MTYRALSLSLLVTLLASVGCGGDDPIIAPLAAVTARVNETVQVNLRVENGDESLSFDYEPPDLPSLRARVTGSGAGGVFQWTPLASHTGQHEFIIQLKDGSTTIHEVPLVINVQAAEDAAPVFVRPGAGGSFDLERDPCVNLDIVIRDDDSSEVTIRGNDLPEGAILTQGEPKGATLEWCPTTDQVRSSQRWRLRLTAEDADHDPTELDYVVVLRAGTKPGCPGDAPTIDVLSPGNEDRVAGATGYDVTVDVNDDMGLRDPPVLLYTTEMPEDPSAPDLRNFEQVVFRPRSGSWAARVPSLGLEEGEERPVYLIVSATDNDDGTGTDCDHRTDTPVRSFIAVGGAAGGDLLEECAPCTASVECASGLCALEASGGVCVGSCSGTGTCDNGACGTTTSVEGSVLAGCGPAAEICGLTGGECTDDRREVDNRRTLATAYTSPISDGQICADDPDYFSIAVPADTQLMATLRFDHASGDLDLKAYGSDGTVVANSATTNDDEEAVFCLAEAGTAYVEVLGYEGSQNSYELTIEQMTEPGLCCVDDLDDDDDSRDTARRIRPNPVVEVDRVICPDDADWFQFDVSEPSQVNIELLIGSTPVEEHDLDIKLFGPTSQIAASNGTEDLEEITETLTEPGTYYLLVEGFMRQGGEYLASIRLTPITDCENSLTCPLDMICNGAECVPRGCTGSELCENTEDCPMAERGASQCGDPCTTNGQCRTGEACKWLSGQRFCVETGSRGLNASCGSFTDCADQRTCVNFPNGSCLRAGCETQADCELNTFCVPSPTGGANICARDCLVGDDLCRLGDGQVCASVTDVSSRSRFVCMPE